jgi:hypothetical protein
MDVGVNRPFKDGIWRSYDVFCIDTDFNKKPRREDVSCWVKSAASTGTTIDAEMVKEDDDDDDICLFSDVDYLHLNKDDTQQSIKEYEADKRYCDDVDDGYDDTDD